MASITLFCAGCRPTGPDGGTLQLDPVVRWVGEQLVVETGVNFQPSPAIREALEHGVELQIDLEVRLGRRYGPIARELETRTVALQIRYLPLLEQWQLQEGATTRTFPRFWLLREALAEPRVLPTGLTAAAAPERPLQLQIRARINRDALPPPMHLPTLFSAQWHPGGSWHTWHFGPS
ncbi:DUF4390 domain-containing protein [Wenzhouxiangella sp. XN79A]|uniref:DUF4390 domain-containing protein n=1 Tax=Wenzhouxiangella sp. XN79A TaxID=2724193 RepID=UPI00144ADF82|nr:DUF4390 domain-containing protein [Wenzhouxiangella sp. XN79A]NKI35856.1 DUF4390 domain-containing protein [Wenzhouxiangella sp. XN79A]